jgi:hypothetical protein
MDLTRGPARDLLRSVGGVLLASGAVAWEIRKAPAWGLGGRMLVVMIPAVVLYALALDVLGHRKLGPRGDPDPWQTVLVVVAVFLNSIWLTLFCRWIGLHGSLVLIGGLGLTSLSSWYAAWRANVRYAALLGALDVVVAWIALWNKILGYQSGNTNRWLLLLIAGILLLGAAVVARLGRRESSELVTAAGVAGVLAASAGVFFDLLGFSLNRVVHAVGLARSVGAFNPRQHFVWDLLLLLIALALITYSARARVRGPGYIGAAGLFVFLFSIGAQVSARLSGGSPSDSAVGWPLTLLLVGVAALALGFIAPRVVRARGGSSPPEASVPPSTPPPS